MFYLWSPRNDRTEVSQKTRGTVRGEAVSKKYWILGKETNVGTSPRIWEFQGLFDEDHKNIAEETAKKHNAKRNADGSRRLFSSWYFLGPCELNTLLPDGETVWPGAYYPTQKEKR